MSARGPPGSGGVRRALGAPRDNRPGAWPSVSTGDAETITTLLDRPAHRCELAEAGDESWRFEKWA